MRGCKNHMKSTSKHQKQKNRLIKCLLFTVLSLITAAALIIFYFYTYQDFTEQDYTLVYISTLVYSIPIFFIGVYVYISLKEYYKKIDNDYLQTQETAAKRQEQLLIHAREQMQQRMNAALSQLNELEHLLRSGQEKEACQLCSRLSSYYQKTRYRHYCRNDIVDVILHTKKEECDLLHIAFTCHILLPEQMNLPAPVLISLFVNLLNNGIEGCSSSGQESLFLKLSVNYKGDYLLLHMENAKNPATVFSHSSTKTDTFSHGLGLLILEEIAGQRDGSCHWQDRQTFFVSDIMLRYR